MSTAALETHVELNRTRLETMLKVLDVDGAVRRVRGGWEATGQRVGLRRGAVRAGARGPRARAARDARLPRHRPVPDAVPARPARRPRAPPLRPLRQLRRPRACRRRSPRRRSRRPRRGCRGPGVVVEPRKMWPTALATSGSTSRARSPTAPSEGRAVARLTDLGYGQALRELFRAALPTARSRCRWCAPSSRCSATGAPRWTPSCASSRPPGRPWSPTSPTGCRATSRCPVRRPVRDRRPVGRPGPGRGQLRPAGRGGRPALRPAGRRSRRRAPVLLVDDLVVTGWTMTLAARAIRRAGAAEVAPLALATQT